MVEIKENYYDFLGISICFFKIYYLNSYFTYYADINNFCNISAKIIFYFSNINSYSSILFNVDCAKLLSNPAAKTFLITNCEIIYLFISEVTGNELLLLNDLSF